MHFGSGQRSLPPREEGRSRSESALRPSRAAAHKDLHEGGAASSGDEENEMDVAEIDASQVKATKGKKKGCSHRTKKFQPQEDIVICSAWLNVSKDPVVGTNQPAKGFWCRIHDYYLENYDRNSTRSSNSVQLRWSVIQRAVSKFSGIFSMVCRRNESGKTEQDRISDAIKIYNTTEPWQFAHCWEILRHEPKWNDKVLEINNPRPNNRKQQTPAPQAASTRAPPPSETPTQSIQGESRIPERPEGRDSAKRKRSKTCGQTASSSAAVEMLKKMHEQGQEQDGQDSKYKEELISIERAKFELQQKQWQAKYELSQQQMMLSQEQLKLQRESQQEQLKLQRESQQEQVKLQREQVLTTRFQSETQIMFADPNSFRPPLRNWVLKMQREILVRDGIDPLDGCDDGTGTAGHS